MTDRAIVYAGVGVQDTDLLRPMNYTRRAINYLARMLLHHASDSGVLCNFSVLAVNALTFTLSDGALIGPLVAEDATAMGSMPAVAQYGTTPLAINLDQTVVGPFAVPSLASGLTVNHLVYAAFATIDTDPVVYYYQNPNAPGQTFRGVGNLGAAQPSTRQERVTVGIVAGVPAAPATQATPAVPAGAVPMYVVTIPAGAAALTLAMITEHPASPFYPALCKVYYGNPNGHVSGRSAKGALPPSTCWDTLDNVLWTCVATGNAAAALWVTPALALPVIPPPFTAIGTFVPGLTNFPVPAGVTRIRARVWGAGGGGGSSSSAAYPGGGGGGGGYGEGIYIVTPGQVIPVTVGVGVIGGNGQASSFGAFLTANGGQIGGSGSPGNVGAGGVGGSVTGQQHAFYGSSGSYGIVYAGSSAVEGGTGAAAFGSSIQRAVGVSGTVFNANAGFTPGGGATGCTGSGAAGGNGYVEIEY